MRNKEQKLEFVRGEHLWDLHRLLDYGWEIKEIHPVVPRGEQFGAYVLLEREKEIGIEDTLNDIGIVTHKPDGTQKTISEILNDIAEKWSELK